MEQQPTQPNVNQNSNLRVENVQLDCSLTGYNYELPPELIAQNPVVPRDSSRLLVVNSQSTGNTTAPLHHIFRDLPELLLPGDLLVMNNTRVMPARLYGHKSTGAEIEVLLLEEREYNCWLALVKPGKRFKRGAKLIFNAKGAGGREREQGSRGQGAGEVETDFLTQHSQLGAQLTATVLETDKATGGRLLQFDVPEGLSLVQLLEVFGEVPLPPYITASEAVDEQYQTVYAKHLGASQRQRQGYTLPHNY
jgi:S-adenosylmethionine:tRNA ribosyltransferase-isomerase